MFVEKLNMPKGYVRNITIKSDGNDKRKRKMNENKTVTIDAGKTFRETGVEVVIEIRNETRIRIWLMKHLIAFAVWIGGFESAAFFETGK